jgi:twinkle protein
MTELPQKVLDWFLKRGINAETLYRNSISYGKIYMPQKEDFVNAVQFPYFRDGNPVNVKYRDGEKNFRMEAGAERILYGLADIAATTVIVEGEIDKLSCDEAGWRNCLSVPDGAPVPTAKDYSSKFEFLENCEKEIEPISTWILAVDNDEPGRVLQEELARRLGKEKCKLVEWPEGCKDANDTLVKYGAGKLSECLSTAKDYPIQGIYDIKSLQSQIRRLYEHEAERGESTGWKELDELYTVRPGEWTLVTGIPGHGKSEFVDNLLVHLMWKKWRFGIFSPENQPLERHVAKILEKCVGMPFYRGINKRMDWDNVTEAIGYINDVFTFILPEEESLTVDGILTLAKTAVLRKGIKGLVVDPWNELSHTRPQNMSETEYISHSISKIRRFARSYGIHIWLIVHPAKMQKIKQDDGTMDYPVPTPYDCHGSAHWRNKADNAISVYRNMKTDRIQIHVQKIRFKEIGKVGVCEMTYDKPTGRLSDAKD